VYCAFVEFTSTVFNYSTIILSFTEDLLLDGADDADEDDNAEEEEEMEDVNDVL